MSYVHLVDCRWSELSPWSRCSLTCGPGGLQTRSRFIVQEAIGDGAPCVGDQTETRECPDNPQCPTTSTTTRSTTTTTTRPTTTTDLPITTTTSFSSVEVTTFRETNTERLNEISESQEQFNNEERKVLDESFIEQLLNAINDVSGTERSPDGSADTVTESTPEETVKPALSSE